MIFISASEVKGLIEVYSQPDPPWISMSHGHFFILKRTHCMHTVSGFTPAMAEDQTTCAFTCWDGGAKLPLQVQRCTLYVTWETGKNIWGWQQEKGMTLSLKSVGQRSSGFFLRSGESWGGGVEKGVKARWKNVLCDGRVLGGQKRQRAQFGVALSRQAPLCLSSLGQEALQLSFFFHFFLSLPPRLLYMSSFPHSNPSP